MGHSMFWRGMTLLVVASIIRFSGAQDLNYKIGTIEEIRKSSTELAWEVMRMYPGNETGKEAGILPGPPTENKGDYFWWQGGALMGAMIDYWHLTGDSQYNKIVSEGILNQVGEDEDFQPIRHRASLGNDDQGFWGMTVMLAAETKFPDPPADQPQWLALAQAVWVTQAAPERHDINCGGGMRWQVPQLNEGYDYKNTIANACFFNLGSRLARYTQNNTYAERAEIIWDWMFNTVYYIDNKTYAVYDGGHIPQNCTDLNKAQFSYNAGLLLQGAAFMYNYTNGAAKWKNAVERLSEGIVRDFFRDGAAFEIACEGTSEDKPNPSCTRDMLMFKGFIHRWIAQSTLIAPILRETLLPVLRKSTEMAIKTCTGPPTGRACGYYWTSGKYRDPALDLTSGVGERMDVMSAVMSLLIEDAPAPVTNGTGGTSQGDPNAGLRHTPTRQYKEITAGDKVGAGILTALVIGCALVTFSWMGRDS